jgi:hypothetical protein
VVHPVQSVFAATLLLMLAFTVNDGSTAPNGAAGDAAIPLACGALDDYGAATASDISQTIVSPCRSVTGR